MELDNFLEIFGGVYEHSKWVAQHAYETGLENKHNSVEGLSFIMKNVVDSSPREQKLNLLCAHPDLAGKLSINKNEILPNVGWFKTDIKPNNSFDFLTEFNNQKFYYVHSFIAEPVNISNQIATSLYKNRKFCAISIKNSNIIGTQFHPEKSSKIGLEFLSIILKKKIN